jgi:hypothetical protein
MAGLGERLAAVIVIVGQDNFSLLFARPGNTAGSGTIEQPPQLKAWRGVINICIKLR